MQSRFPRPLQRTACAAMAAALCAGGLAQPRPSDLREQLHGRARFEIDGSTTRIVTTNGPRGNHSAFDWRNFQVPGNTSVIFQQPDAASLSINRVVNGPASAIDGLLQSNGRLVLVNPAGIAFGRGAVVDTAGFTASTLFMSRSDAIAGRLRFTATPLPSGGDDDDDDDDDDRGGDSGSGALRVQGRIVANGGDVVLISRDIEVDRGAIVEARGGDVVLAAGRTVEVTGRGLEGIRMEVRAPEDRAVNLGTLKGDSVAIFAGRLRHSGLIQANSVTVEGGRVILQALDEGVIEGRIEATRPDRGGFVHISGDRLVLKAATFIDVRHANGGGEIRIEARDRLEVEEGVQLRAEATLRGEGGTVVAASGNESDFRGDISVQGAGGASSGPVRVAASGTLTFGGSVETGALEATRVPDVPRSGLPEPLQAMLRQRESERDAFLAMKLEPLSSEPLQPGERRVVIDAVSCSVTR